MTQRGPKIAIVGMGCRFPAGGETGGEGFWRLLAEGRSGIADLSSRRWPAQGAARWAGLIDDIAQFDAGFFGIAPREAASLDPQQRLLLEVSWEALENAGIQAATLRGSLTAIFVGGGMLDYLTLIREREHERRRNVYATTGNGGAFAAGRLAYVFGTEGPCAAVDTACSSSLVAVHLACDSLRKGDSELAIAAGVNVIASSRVMDEIVLLRALSPSGRCRTFDADADGFVRAEGCGVVILKRLDDALRDGDRVWGVIRGSAINHDGHTSSLTTPSSVAQRAVLRAALHSAGVRPEQVSYVEAHGTGTPLGDPIEVDALQAELTGLRAPGSTCVLGSAKANIGHLEAAAGVAGLIKTVLSLHHEQIPAQLHFETLNPRIRLEGTPFEIAREARPWPRTEVPRIAGVSSFGLSGTNAHVIVEEAPSEVRAEPNVAAQVPYALPLLLSGRDEGALRGQARRLSAWLREHADARFVDVVHTAALHRTHFDERAVIVASEAGSSLEALEALAQGQHDARVLRGRAHATGKVVFVFPGQGSQWLGMGKALLEQSEVFAESVRACDAALSPWTGWSVLSLLRGDASDELPPYDRVDAVQTSLFALGVGLSALWRSLGLTPAAVVGHSQGEVAAAVVSGALSLADGARVVAARSQAVRQRCGAGGMLLVERPLAEVEERLKRYGTALSIAAVNTASSTVVSGENGALAALKAELEAASAFCRLVNVDYASHSAQMDVLLPGLMEELSTISPRAGQIPFYSTVESRLLSGEELDATYWCRNLREPVRLDRALTQLLEDGHDVFVEVSAHPVLAVALRSASEDRGGVVIGSLAREQGGLDALLRGLGALHAHGHALDWKRVLGGYGGRLLDLPTYAFQRERFWVEAGKGRSDARAMGLVAVEHPLLGALMPLADSDGYVFSSRLSLLEQSWLSDHAVHGTVLVPGTGVLELALHAARTVGLAGVSELTLEQPLVLSRERGLQLQVSVGAVDAHGERSLSVYGREDEQSPWQRHASGILQAASNEEEAAPSEFEALRSWPVPGAEALEMEGLYPRLSEAGLQYGASFQGLVEAFRDGSVAYGRVVLPEAVRRSAEQYGVHPALLDAALHTLLAASMFGEPEAVQLPFAWSDVRLYAAGASELRVRVERRGQASSERLSFSVLVADGTGEPVASIGSLQVRPARREELQSAQRSELKHLYQVEFQPVPLEAVADVPAPVVVGGTGELAQLLGTPWYADLESLLAQAKDEQAPQRVIIDATGRSASFRSRAPALASTADERDVLTAVHEQTAGALSLLQGLLAAESLSQSELVWVTCSALACGPDEDVEDLVHAPVWGLIRAAHSEHPERVLRLVDLANVEVERELLTRGLSATREPELALRGGVWLAARMCSARSAFERSATPRALSREGTVLITGGSGELGSALAQHLVSRHGIKHLVLTSRRGAETPGTEALIGKLSGLGAQSVEVLACDVTVRAQIEAVLARIPSERPLTGVFHLSAVLDDGLLEGQTAERLSAVLAPKVDGAWHLHELTRDQDLASFVMFASVAGALGAAGQSTYAAANIFLDALSAYRRQRGLAATSLSWGLWQPSGTGLTGRLKEADLARMARLGMAPLSQEQGLALLDAALARPEPQFVPVRLELGTLQRTFEQAGAVPPLWRTLVRTNLRRASLPASRAAASGLRERLSSRPEAERLDVVLELVRGETAAVLGLAGASAVAPDKELQKLGMDSLMAVELRNRLSAVAATKVPATMAFDYPTPRAIAGWLLKQAFGEPTPARAARKPALSSGTAEPIAIVSMACRLPGGIASPESYWQALAEGLDVVEGFPSRWDGLDLYDPNPDAVGKSYAREGGFVHGVELFDAAFFGTSAREARAMDPQQRLLLETTWEALERAGIPPSSLNESLTGVYVGCMGSSYGLDHVGVLEALDGYLGTGTAASVLSGRVAYVLGLQGPALTVDTACSSSLTALHLACAGLRQGECDLALAGGVTVMASPGIFVEFSRLRGMSPDGRCKSFSARADGAGWGEGCGVLVLKRLSDVQRDGDRVLALIRGSAVNQDGRSQGLSAPNGPSQQRVIQDALSSCAISPSEIDAVEAHGTGTTLGDPIEAGALAAVFGPGRSAERPLYLGSSKSNLGHTQAAAGVAGVMKVVLSLQHELLPRTLHAQEPSPHIAWEGSGLSLLQEARAWPRGQRVRRAGVSSFGVSGTNAHVVIEEAPVSAGAQETIEASVAEVPYALPLLLSGRDEAALRAQAERLSGWLREHADARFVDVVRTAALHRTHHDERAVIMASEAGSSLEALEALAQGQHDLRVVRGRAHTTGKVVFVFPGQGSQWQGMGKALLEQSEVFAESVRACDAALMPWTGWSVLSLLRGDVSTELPPYDRVDAVQTSLFALSVGLSALWRSLGLEPVAVVGHSQGEVAAAVVSGALSLQDGARVVAARSQAVRQRCGAGGMLLVERPVAEVEERLKHYGAALSIAAVNTASSTVVSGDNGALASLKAELEAASVFCRQVNVDYASHSAQMDVLLPGLMDELSTLTPRAGQIPFYSTVESRPLGGQDLDGSYWCRNLREPVRLDRALTQLLEDGHGVFVEVSAHPVLAVALRSASEEAGGVVIGSLAREQGGLDALLRGLGTLHVHGHVLDWKRVLGGYGGRLLDLPTYAFQRDRFWLEAAKGRSDARSMGLASAEHPLLGALMRLADSDGYVFSSRLSLSEQSWLADHAVQGTVLVPGTGLLELALHAARTVGLSSVSELTLEQPLVLSRERGRELQVSVGGTDERGERSVSVYSREDEQSTWQRHASGTLQAASSDVAFASEFAALRSWPVAGAEAMTLEGLYPQLWEAGLHYGDAFRGLVEAFRDGPVAYGRVVLPEPLKESAAQYGLHPALLDAALHTLLATSLFGEAESVQLPFVWSDVHLYATGATELRVRVERKETAGSGPSASVLVADGSGEPVASIGSLQVRPARMQELHAAQRSELKHLYRVEFQPVPLEVVAQAPRNAVVGGTGALALRLGATCYADLETLLAQWPEQEPPERVIVDATERPAAEPSDFLGAVHEHTAGALSLLQRLLAEQRLAHSELVWLTCSAVGCGADWGADDLAHAPLWGLVRSARSEHPERVLRLIDIGSVSVERELLARALSGTHEPELALRAGVALATRLCAQRTPARDGTLELAAAGPWQLRVQEKGRLDSFELAPLAESGALAPREVRLSVRAAGMNFLDVLNALDMAPAPGLGFEYAGVVLEVGAEVTGLSVGDRVMGVGPGAFAREIRRDERLLTAIPAHLSFEQAATIPLAYLTALYAFEDLGELRAGQRVLVHAAAGGVGTAAVQLARALGAEVFGTASEGKWSHLSAQGLDEAHIASSRDLSFEQKWSELTGGAGMDVVLNSLTKEYVDASLRLLRPGGRFLEMGKLDIRDAAEVKRQHPGVRYHAFDLIDFEPDRIAALLAKLSRLLRDGVVRPLPFAAYDVRQAPSAFRYMAQAKHVGKLVLRMPRAFSRSGTVLITGGTGELGSALAEHLVVQHGVKHLVLTSRRGADAPGAQALIATLQGLGAESVEVLACDVTVRAQVEAVLSRIPSSQPLTGVFHLSATLSDGLVQAQTAERLATVLAPKVDGAWHLHELTQDQDLACFVLFSSAAGTLGGAGQSNYAAANTFLDALAAQRQKCGLAGMSLSWGLWRPSGKGLTAQLGRADLSRMERQGISALPQEQGLALLDAALGRPEAQLVPIGLELGSMQRKLEQTGEVPALLRTLIRPGLRRAAAGHGEVSALRARLAALPGAERQPALLEWVRTEVATVLGISSQAVPADNALQKIGLDSLTAVELRNRLSKLAGASLPATLAFDYPTPQAIARLLLERAFGTIEEVRPAKRLVGHEARTEPVAIVSMACRLPGGIDSPESYWQVLAGGLDVVEGFPPRWDALDLYDPNPDAPGKSYTREGGFVHGVELFDAAFFGTSAREAQAMDPQQRLLLETAWEALERAGIQPASLNESLTGVYVGSWSSEYGPGSGCFEALDGYTATGTLTSVVSGRVAYVLGLQGPALTVDTACSSSLTALHLACMGLRHGECDLALAGGVTVLVTPASFVEFSRLRGMAPDGRCKSFSAGADGAGWGEGCGVLVLKRLSDAQRDGDQVLALIRGSAANQDGRSQGLSAPNGPSQQRVIRDALSSCGLAPSEIDAVEAHGTGTALGDPIEAGALAAVFGPERTAERPLYLGSSKSNLGHTQAAAGVAGVMKMVLSLQHELLPRTLHVDEPSPHIHWEGSGLSLLREARAWGRRERARRAGVSSFGISGTNVHLVLEEAPATPDSAEASVAADLAYSLPLLVSGRDEAALRAQAERLSVWLREHADARFVDVVHTAALHRTHFDERAAIMASEVESSLEALEALAQGQHDVRVERGRAHAAGKVVFVFPGQGSQWLGMGKALLEQSEVFAESVRACDAALSPWTGWSVLSLLRGEQTPELPPYDRVDAVQTALFAMSVSLSALWRSLGLTPAAVVGHSQGEIVAAVVSGALSLEDGARVVAARSQAVRQRCGAGGMLLVERPVAEVEERLKRYAPALSVAAVNTSSSTVVSGDNGALSSLKAELEEASVFCRLVNVDYASHSAQMDMLLPGLMKELSTLSPRAGQIPFYSTVEGEPLSGEELDGRYWCRNLREPVRLDRALARLLEDGHGVFVEVSAHPVLGVALRSASEDRGGVVIGSLQREQGQLDALLRGLGVLHAHGHTVDWRRVLSAYGGRLVELPTYAFQRERFWLDAGKGKSDARSMGLVSVEHPLLGALTPLADSDGYVFSSRLSLAEHGWLGDHAVQGTVLVPGTGMLELALHAARTLGLSGVSELTLEQPLVLAPDGGRQMQVSVGGADAQGARSLHIYSREDEQAPWQRHASGTLSAGASDVQARAGAGERNDVQARAFATLRGWPVAGAEVVDLEGFYARLWDIGLQYGTSFRGLVEAYRDGSAAYGRVVLPEPVKASAQHYGVHPALLDAALHVMAALSSDEPDSVQLPFAWSDVRLYATGASELRVRMERNEQAGSVSLLVSDGAGEPVASVGALQVRPARLDELQAAQRREQRHLYRVEFQPVPLEVIADEPAPAVVGCTGLAQLLGAPCYADLAALPAHDSTEQPPKRVIVDLTAPSEERDLLTALRDQTARALGLLHDWLADERFASTELVWVTSSAVDCGPDWQLEDLARAPLWGLLRAARNEHPERALRLVDIEALPLERELVVRGLSASREPELALRGGAWLAARLVRVTSDSDRRAQAAAAAMDAGHVDGPPITNAGLDPNGTVLMTGGTGELGAMVAQRLVAQHGVKHLVLTSRRGERAPGVQELISQLHAFGAESVQVLACDVSQRSQVEAALARVSPEHPLTGVFHLAAALDDGVLLAQTPERLATVLAPKADAAWHLHVLTAHQPLAQFVLFSSAAGTFGAAGQSNYAAANAFVDALAAYRRNHGLPAQSQAWGLWQPSGIGLTAKLDKAQLASLTRQGIAPLSGMEGLDLLDAALARPEAQLVPVRLDLAGMQRQFEQAEEVPGLFRALFRRALRRATAGGHQGASLRERLATLAEPERVAAVVELVQNEVTTLLGRAGRVDPDQPLQKLGLDSLSAVELRKRLAEQAGVTLPATLAFDYPTPRAIARLLCKRMDLPVASDQEQALKLALSRLSLKQLEEAGLLNRILQLANGDSVRLDELQKSEPEVAVEDMSLTDIQDELRNKMQSFVEEE